MIGDSLTRYRYMEMVYFRHYSKYAPREVISWRKGGHDLSYFQLFKGGLYPHGYRLPSELHLAKTRKDGDNDGPFLWEYTDFVDFAALYLAKLPVSPTVIMINIGHWNDNKEFTANMEKNMLALRAVAPHVKVLWVGTAPHRKEVVEGSRYMCKGIDSAAQAYCGANPDVCTYVPDSEALKWKPSDMVDNLHFKKGESYQKVAEWIDEYAGLGLERNVAPLVPKTSKNNS